MPTKALIANAMGVDVSSIYTRAATEGWRKLNFRFPQVKSLQRDMIEAAAELAVRDAPSEAAAGADGGTVDAGTADRTDAESIPAGRGSADSAVEDAPDAVEMMARASRFVSRQILGLMHKADRRGGRLDKAQIDGLVSMSRMMDRWEVLAKERQIEDKKKSDDELAGLLKEIDTRIIMLAEAEAGRLCQERRAGTAG